MKFPNYADVPSFMESARYGLHPSTRDNGGMTQRQLMRATVETPIGRMMMASDGEGLTELCLEDWWWATDHQAVLDSNRESDSEPDVFRITREWLTAYFAGERPRLGSGAAFASRRHAIPT